MKLPEIVINTGILWHLFVSVSKAELNNKLELCSMDRKASFIRIFHSTYFQTLENNINRRMSLLSMCDNSAVD
jgi:hypothetical protein